MAGFGAQGEHASSSQAQTAAAIGLPREKFQQYRQKAGQEKPNCQQRRMSYKEDEDKDVSLGTHSFSGCVAAFTNRRSRAQRLEPESFFPKGRDETRIWSFILFLQPRG